MAKVGYIFIATNGEEYAEDKAWMQQYGCVQVIEELSEHERLRPMWKQLISSLERGDELVVSRFSNALRGTRELATFIEYCRVKVVIRPPKKSERALSKLEREKNIVNMYNEGHSIDDIFAISGFTSRSSVFRILNKHGVTLNRGPHSGPLKKRNKE